MKGLDEWCEEVARVLEDKFNSKVIEVHKTLIGISGLSEEGI